MKIVLGLIIKKNIVNKEDIELYVKDVETYINHVDKLIILNMTKDFLDGFFKALKRFQNIEYSVCEDYGQVNNYEMIYQHAIGLEADYVIALEQGCFYEEGSFLALKRFLIESEQTPAVLTSVPLYTCIEKKDTDVEWRNILGCKLNGALVNVKKFELSNGLDKNYYQTTFDYDYCISQRLKGNTIVLMPNVVLRDRNYTVIEKRVLLFFKKSSYDRDLMDVYYETRNRYYLWEKYKKQDIEYIKIDKRLFKKEKREMRMVDVNYRDKLAMMFQANRDFSHGQMGKFKSSK